MSELMSIVDYIMGHAKGKVDGEGNITFEGNVTCTDPNNDGNIVITFEEG